MGGPTHEHCYGVAKTGENNCAAANGKHSCAGQAKGDYSGQEFKEVAKGTCEQMNGQPQAVRRHEPEDQRLKLIDFPARAA